MIIRDFDMESTDGALILLYFSVLNNMSLMVSGPSPTVVHLLSRQAYQIACGSAQTNGHL